MEKTIKALICDNCKTRIEEDKGIHICGTAPNPNIFLYRRSGKMFQFERLDFCSIKCMKNFLDWRLSEETEKYEEE